MDIPLKSDWVQKGVSWLTTKIPGTGRLQVWLDKGAQVISSWLLFALSTPHWTFLCIEWWYHLVMVWWCQGSPQVHMLTPYQPLEGRRDREGKGEEKTSLSCLRALWKKSIPLPSKVRTDWKLLRLLLSEPSLWLQGCNMLLGRPKPGTQLSPWSMNEGRWLPIENWGNFNWRRELDNK